MSGLPHTKTWFVFISQRSTAIINLGLWSFVRLKIAVSRSISFNKYVMFVCTVHSVGRDKSEKQQRTYRCHTRWTAKGLQSQVRKYGQRFQFKFPADFSNFRVLFLRLVFFDHRYPLLKRDAILFFFACFVISSLLVSKALFTCMNHTDIQFVSPGLYGVQERKQPTQM